VIKQIYQEWKERRKARIEECRNWMPEPYRITPEELEEINQLLEEMEEINQLLEEMDKMEQRGGRGSRGR
jgi:DNA-binding PadR family transcriptional regulator